MRPLPVLLACVMASTVPMTGRVTDATAPLMLNSARVTLDGTSNIHAFTAWTTTVTITAAEIAGTLTADPLEHVLQPAGLKSFEVTIPAASLVSEKGDVNKNMHKALKVQEHPDIRFRLGALEQSVNGHRATGSLTIAGVERQVALNLQVERKGAALAVTGNTELLMTDYGIAPPKAMLGMLKTNPKVQIRIELLLGAPLT
jgi:polyisoprenoid-binding protein YceI